MKIEEQRAFRRRNERSCLHVTSSLLSFSVYSNKREDFLELKDNFFNPFGLYNEDDLDALVRGMAKEPSQYLDRFVRLLVVLLVRGIKVSH